MESKLPAHRRLIDLLQLKKWRRIGRKNPVSRLSGDAEIRLCLRLSRISSGTG
jgi:hypothetical protein